MLGIVMWGIHSLIMGENTSFNKLLVYGSLLLLFFSLVGIHSPSQVKLDKEKIVLKALFVTHTFYWSNLTFCQIRVYEKVGKVYLRLGTKRIIGGRYWISSDINEFDDLWKELKKCSFSEHGYALSRGEQK